MASFPTDADREMTFYLMEELIPFLRKLTADPKDKPLSLRQEQLPLKKLDLDEELINIRLSILVPKWLRVNLNYRRLSAHDLANAIGADISTVQGWLRGRSIPLASALFRIEFYFETFDADRGK